NAGILQATSGTLSAQGPVGTSNGTFAADDGETLLVSGNISDGGSGNNLTKTGAGTLTISGTNTISGDITINQGILNVSAGSTSVAALSVNRSGISGIPSRFVVDGGMFIASSLSNLMGSDVGFPGPGQFVLQAGSAQFNGGLKSSQVFGPIGGFIRIEGGAFSATDVNIVRNSAGTVDFASGWVITGGDANVGTIELGSTNSNGALSVEGGALTATGPITIARQSSPGRGGAMRVTGGTFVSTDATDGIILSQQDEDGNADQIASASFSGGVSTVEKFKMGYDANVNAGSATITVDGGMLYIGSGGVEVNGSGTFAAAMNLSSGTLGARTNWAGAADIMLPMGGNINIKAADAADLPHDITLNGNVSGAGSLTKSGAGTLTLTRDNTYGGTTIVHAGALVIDGTHTFGGEYTIDAGARLAGNGIIESIVHSTGTISPGGSPGTLTIGALEMDGNAALQIELGGTTAGSGYDRLVVEGAAMLDGTLDVSFVNGFVPAAGDTFDVFDWGALSGTFATVTLPELPADLRWNGSQLYNTGELIVRLAGDFNGDGAVDAADYVAWRKGLGMSYTQTDYNVWRVQYGQTAGKSANVGASASVPEPVFALMLIIAALILSSHRGLAVSQTRMLSRRAGVRSNPRSPISPVDQLFISIREHDESERLCFA
ncbi:MAG TPA: autotransporter-associated beta strand repeat-containing protein, partial [Lacipirellulaceae bacterium]|nr:autotransporter-associated beta strand repeat-containing protein [Lacipirellulaceae bacterium]